MTNIPNQPTYVPRQAYPAGTPNQPQPIPYQQTTPQQSVGAQSYQATHVAPTQGYAPGVASQAPVQAAPTPVASVTTQTYAAPNSQAKPTYQAPVAHTTNAPVNPDASNGESTDRDREFESEDKKLYHKRTRIVKFATNKTYFEVFNFGFKHGRIAIKMSNYKPQYSEILISLKFGEYFELKDLILSGAIHHLQPDNYKNLHFYNKGTASKYSKDGSVSARQLGVQAPMDPNKYVVTFVAKEGPGKQDARGLIQFVGKANTTVMYPMTRAMLVELFNTIDMHLQGYMNACYQYQFEHLPNFTKETK